MGDGLAGRESGTSLSGAKACGSGQGLALVEPELSPTGTSSRAQGDAVFKSANGNSPAVSVVGSATGSVPALGAGLTDESCFLSHLFAFPFLALQRGTRGPQSPGQGSIFFSRQCTDGGGMSWREPQEDMAMPSAREDRPPSRQPMASTAMPSARPAGWPVRRRLRLRRHPRAASGPRPRPRASSAPELSSPSGPGRASGACEQTRLVRAKEIVMGYVSVRTVGATEPERAGMISTISRTAARGMLAGSCVCPARRNVARSARERVFG